MPARRVAAEVGDLRGVEEVAAGGVGLAAVRGVAEREEQAARVAGHPEHAEPPRARGERDLDVADAA